MNVCILRGLSPLESIVIYFEKQEKPKKKKRIPKIFKGILC